MDCLIITILEFDLVGLSIIVLLVTLWDIFLFVLLQGSLLLLTTLIRDPFLRLES